MKSLKNILTSTGTSLVANHSSLQNPLLAASQFSEAFEGRVEQEIPPGEAGRVFYNGTSWKARIDGEKTASIGQKVLVLGNLTATMLLVEPR